MTQVRLHTLGQCAVETDKGRLLPSASVPFALVIYLALERGRKVPRSQILDLLYPGVDARSAGHCLRQMIYNLRQTGIPIAAEGRHISLPSEELLADYERVFAVPGVEQCESAAVGGGFLPGFSPALSAGYTDWLDQQRSWVHAQLRRRLLEVMDDRRKHGQWAEAERIARACLVIDPLNEEATCVIAESMALAGSKLEAVRLLESYEAEVGRTDGNLGVPVRVLRRRICERLSYSESRAGPLPLIGRDKQMTVLHRAMERAGGGSMVACVITGEPGVGKTRLAASLADAAVVVGWRVARVACQPHDARRPLGVFSDLVPIVLRMPGALGCSPEATELLTRLFRLDAASHQDLSPQMRDPETLSASIVRAISELCDAVTSETPLMVVIDSAEWMDPVSRRVALDLISERKDRRLLMAVTTTDGECLDTRHVNVHPLALGALSEDDSLALFNHCASRHNLVITDAFRSWCLAIAAGNPLFIQTIVSHYASTRQEYDVPRQLTALLHQRLSSLSSVSRRALEACAVLGSNCTVPALEAMLEYPRYQLIDAFGQLEQAGFVSTDGSAVTICHPLLRETALSEIPSGTLKLMHRGAAVALTGVLEETQSAGLAWECAQHWTQSGERARAIEVLRSCARHLLGVGEAAEAVEALKNAVGIAEGAEVRVQLLDELIEAADTAALWRTCLDAVGELDLLFGDAATPPNKAAVYFVIATEAMWRLGEDISDRTTRLADLAASADLTPVLRARAATPIMVFADQSDDRRIADRALQICNTIPVDDASEERLLLLRMIYETTFGTRSSTAEVANKATMLAASLSTPVTAIRLRGNAGYTYRASGMFAEAFTALTIAFADARRINATGSAAAAAAQLCDVCLDVGDIQRAKYWHKVAGEVISEAGGGNWFAHEVQSALLAAADGDFVSAGTYLERCSSAPTSTLAGHQSFVACLEAMLRTLRGDPPGEAIGRIVATMPTSQPHTITQLQDVTTTMGAWLLRRLGRTSDAELLLSRWQESASHTRLRGVFSVMTDGEWPFEPLRESFTQAFSERAQAWDAESKA
jgi:DNA-binding SARP family transcriptional activator